VLRVEVRVFLVDDLRNMHTLFRELFASLGRFRVVATSTTEAEAKLWMLENEGAWDLAIVDLVLDQGSGIGVLRYSKQNWPSAKVVIFSGYASQGIREHCIALGADAVFDKAQSADFIAWLQAMGQDGSGTAR
jgi:DNA-binding NarL/FixJ family response regulator